MGKSHNVTKTLRRARAQAILIPLIYEAAFQAEDKLKRGALEDMYFQEEVYQREKQRKQHKRTRERYLHPSSLSGCERAQVFRFQKAPKGSAGTPEDTFKSFCRFHIGTSFHVMLQTLLKWHGSMLESEIMFRYPPLWLEGSCDGVVVIDGIKWVVEFKSMDTHAFSQLCKPKDDHIEQGNLYMHVLGIPRVIFLYWDKSKHYLKEYRYTQDPLVMKEIRRKSEQIVWNVWKGTIPDKPYSSGTKMPCSFCPYWNLCWYSSARLKKFRRTLSPKQQRIERPNAFWISSEEEGIEGIGNKPDQGSKALKFRRPRSVRRA